MNTHQPSEHNIATVRDLVVEFDKSGTPFQALKGIDLDIGIGEIVALVGESGSGKTVLGSCLLGLVPGDAKTSVTGSVNVEGIDMVHGTERDRRWVRRHVLGAVFQDPLTSLDPMMRVGAQVGERGASDDRILTAFEECGIPEPKVRIRYWPHQLSGGLRQRVSIAGAITAANRPADKGTERVNRPEGGIPALIIADEPTTALDVRVQDQIVKLFGRLRDEHGCSVLLITHDLGVAAQIADRIVVMSHGEVCESGPTAQIISSPQHPYTQGLIASRLDVSDPFPHREPVQEPPNTLMTMTNIVKDFRTPHVRGGVKRVLHDVDLQLDAGEALVLVGESGSGKSTLLRIAAGLETPTAGFVDIARSAGKPQLIFQDARSSLTPWIRVSKQLGERLALAGVPREERPARVAELLRQVGLDERMAQSRPRELSGGQCQRAAIARAMASGPGVLLCDEPVSALDATLASQVVDLLDDLRRTTGVALLFVTHDLAVAKRIATRVAVLNDGRIVEQGDVQQIFNTPTHHYTRQLLEASPSLAKVKKVAS